MPSPAFLVFVPMRALQQNDEFLSWRKKLREAEGDEAAYRLEHITQAAYDETESNLCSVSPEMSHVAKEFANGDQQFWAPQRAPDGARPRGITKVRRESPRGEAGSPPKQ